MCWYVIDSTVGLCGGPAAVNAIPPDPPADELLVGGLASIFSNGATELAESRLGAMRAAVPIAASANGVPNPLSTLR